MIALSTKGRYGARLMLELALCYGREPVLLKDIAKRQAISEGYLQHLLPALKAAGLVNSTRGAHGGYMLAKPPSKITLKEVVQAMEGSLAPVRCIDAPSLCRRVRYCVTRDIWQDLRDNISRILESVTLQDMAERQRKNGKYSPTYSI
ncbi:MAG: Rrf2 family transcriptional regulator [Candidatus Omnitrophota bacterium]|nr:Rrf2 family transcriptional regulator [Candidatus Omnitrophota bacterium]